MRELAGSRKVGNRAGCPPGPCLTICWRGCRGRREWARGFFRDSAPFATGGVYVNFITDDESERIQAAYGPGYARLAAIKQKYDPQNLFRMNQNIRPKA